MYFIVPIKKLLDRFYKATALIFRDSIFSWRFKITRHQLKVLLGLRGEINQHCSAGLSWGSLHSFWYRTWFLTFTEVSFLFQYFWCFELSSEREEQAPSLSAWSRRHESILTTIETGVGGLSTLGPAGHSLVDPRLDQRCLTGEDVPIVPHSW